jgi:hypothetical protein
VEFCFVADKLFEELFELVAHLDDAGVSGSAYLDSSLVFEALKELLESVIATGNAGFEFVLDLEDLSVEVGEGLGDLE